MSVVAEVGNEIDGCQVQTTFVKRTYVFSWSIKNFPPYPSLFQVRSPEFRPVSDRLFCATVERKRTFKSPYYYNDIIWSIFLKEGLPIGIEHTISITNSMGEILYDTYEIHMHSLVSGCHPEFNIIRKDGPTLFKIEDYPCINFKCTMEFNESSTDSVHSHPKPSPSQNLVDDPRAIHTSFYCADHCLKVEECIPLFLSKMLKSPMDEKEKGVISIKDIKLQIVKLLMEFLYTEVLCEDEFNFVCDLYYAANRFDVSSLRKTCTDFLLAKLNVDNACQVLSLANQHSDIQFRDAVMEFILFHFDDILQTKRWSEFLDEDTKLAAKVLRCRTLKSKNSSNNMPVA